MPGKGIRVCGSIMLWSSPSPPPPLPPCVDHVAFVKVAQTVQDLLTVFNTIVSYFISTFCVHWLMSYLDHRPHHQEYYLEDYSPIFYDHYPRSYYHSDFVGYFNPYSDYWQTSDYSQHYWKPSDSRYCYWPSWVGNCESDSYHSRMRSRGAAYYSSAADYGQQHYYSQQPQHSHYPTVNAYDGATSATAAQHNHPPYYQHNPATTSGVHSYDSHQSYPQQHQHQHQQQQQSMYDSSYPSYGPQGSRYDMDPYAGHHGAQQAPATTAYPYQASAYQPTAATAPAQVASKMSYPNPVPPATAPTSLNLKSTTAKNPYGPTGPYGVSTGGLDYYRKLYYPYDPITGEYMKDTPPPDTSNTSLLPNSMPLSSDQQQLMQHLQRQHPNFANFRNPMDGTNMLATNSYYRNFENENDSLLLCCDFLIPRPSINCLIITLFAMLVLIIIFTVVKFTIIFPSDSSNEETLALVDQIVVLLLFAALIALIWIFGIYFTSRRTRRQISNLLSCAGNPATVETSLAPDAYGNYMYGNHQHHHHGALGATGSRLGRPTTTNYSNYRYANNFV